ncbi:MAG: hypothetical protein P8M22_13290 [Phycisphaerales bacterium]|nr:hypothetical protein [Phycisphaerales bacterium]
MTNERNELSSAGARRREQMLPLLQDAMRDQVRRKRQRKIVAGSLLVLLASIGLVEVYLLRSMNPGAPETFVVDGGVQISPSPVPATELPADSKVTFQAFDSSALYARALERNPDVFITTPVQIPTECLAADKVVLVEYLTTEQMMSELSMFGIDSAIFCSDQDCTLVTAAQKSRQVNEGQEVSGQEI